MLWKTYKVAAASGELGPKRVEGDLQVPEGFYRVVVFNNQSRFHLSLGLNYPNASDRIRSDKTSPGGDIYVHGRRASIGCLAMTDPIIEEIYVMAYEAKKAGNAIPVHIFPSREIAVLSREYPQFANFWAELAPAYTYFERTRLLPRIRTDARGRYIVN